MENNWWARKAAQIQSYANINDRKSFYEALSGAYGPSRFSLHPVRCTDDVLIKNRELILERWAEYLQNLLNKVHTTDPGFLDDLPTLPIIPKLDEQPSFDEVEKSILSLKDNKAAGPDNIPAEVIKHGGCSLHRRLHNFILDCWSAKSVQQQWKNAKIILGYQFHTGMCAQVVMAGSQSSSFPVEVGVKQGCVLALIIFNLLLVAMTLVSHRDLQSSDCAGIGLMAVSSTCDVSIPKQRLLLR